MAQSWRYARVEYDEATSLAVSAKLVGWAALGGLGPERGPGLSQGEAVQFAAGLAALRHLAASGGSYTRVAVYSPAGAYLGTRLVNAQSEISPDLQYLPIVGDEPLPRETYPRQLCLAIDRVLYKIAHAEQGAEVPAGYGGPGGPPLTEQALTTLAALPLGAIALIVAGSAVAVVGAVAVWRYLDPDVRMQAAAVDASARAYQQRLQVAAATGTMPPPSIVEQSTGEHIRKLADEQQWRYLAYGAAGVVGISGGAAALAYFRRESA